MTLRASLQVADHFGSATSKALACQQSVFEDLAKAGLWEKDYADGRHKLRKLQGAMRATAALAARAGAAGIEPAIQLLKMAQDEAFGRGVQIAPTGSDRRMQASSPEHMQSRESIASVPAEALTLLLAQCAVPAEEKWRLHVACGAASNLSAAAAAAAASNLSAAAAAASNLSAAAAAAAANLSAAAAAAAANLSAAVSQRCLSGGCRYRYRLLSGGLSQPWPDVAVQLLSDGCSASLLRAFAGLLEKAAERAELGIASPREAFAVDARVLAWVKDAESQLSKGMGRWKRGRITAVKGGAGSDAKYDVDIDDTAVLDDLVDVEAKHLVSSETGGLGAMLRRAAALGKVELVGVLLDVGVSVFASDENASTSSRTEHPSSTR